LHKVKRNAEMELSMDHSYGIPWYELDLSHPLLKKYRTLIGKLRGIKDRDQYLGKLLEVATEIALLELKIFYLDHTNDFHNGNLPEFSMQNLEIECKNWVGSVEGRYRIGKDRFNKQIKPRFNFLDYEGSRKKKILITLKDVRWDAPVLEEIKKLEILLIEVDSLTHIEDIPKISLVIEEKMISLCRIDPYVLDNGGQQTLTMFTNIQ